MNNLVTCRRHRSAMWITGLLFAFIVQVFGNQPPSIFAPQHKLYSESTAVGSVLYTLSARDPDNSELTFSIDPENRETAGLVKLGTPTVVPEGNGCRASVPVILIRELDKDYEPEERILKITISDKTNSITGLTRLTIKGINDVSPNFINLPYRATIREDATPGSLVFNRTEITDLDRGYGYVYTMQAIEQAFQRRYADLFTINRDSGFVYLNGTLDYEQNTFYQFKITVEELIGTEATSKDLSANTELIMTVIDIQDTPPSFLNQPYMKTIREDISVGDTVITVSALDGDHGVPNDIKYYISPPDPNFSIDSTTGVIRVKLKLDSDVPEIRNKGNVFDLTVVAEEVDKATGRGTETNVTTHVTVTVQDVNDNPPTFTRQQYTGTVVEEMLEGIPVTFNLDNKIIISDKDQGDNSKFSVSLWKDGEPFSVFRPTPDLVRSKSELQILIQNSSALDYETLAKNGGNPIVFQILASETSTAERHNSTATVTVTVTDRNDNYPRFSQTSYVGHVNENSPNLTDVIQIQATDRDSGLFGTITFSFRGNVRKFSIDPNSGQVRVAGQLDREAVSIYYMTVEARDGGNIATSVQLTIHIDDLNDETPKFHRDTYEGYIRESSTLFLRPVVVKAEDDDMADTNNSVVRYGFKSIPVGLENNFTIDSISGAIQVVGSLDYEMLPGLKSTIKLIVVAHDLGDPVLSSTAIVSITVEDVNDNDPIFQEPFYQAAIDEDTAPGSTVETVMATDKDGDPPNNEVIYRIQAGALDKFHMDANSGKITVEIGASFDRDLQPYYEVTVVAADKGTPPRHGRCSVNITINDVNNKKPQFVPIREAVTVSEDASVGHVVIRSSATDPDHNPRLVYDLVKELTRGFTDDMSPVANSSLLKDYFTIDSLTGDIKVASNLDRERADIVTVVVTVDDKNSINGPQITTGTVTITLLDINDNSPKFTQPIYFANVSEGIATDVVTVRATDVDKSSSSISYRIQENDQFVINKNTGTLSIVKKLDREVADRHNITVVADDNGQGRSFTDVAFVIVRVLDINDNSPVFKDGQQSKQIAEDAAIHTVVMTITAQDRDDGEFGRIEYSIHSGNENESFSLNKNSGVLKVANNLDRERWSKYTLRIEARDNPDGDADSQNIKYTDVIINVDDVNDNAPGCSKNVYHLREPILENAQIDANIFRVRATDRDVGENREILYSLVANDTNATDLFKIDRDSGQIKVARLLDGYYGTFYLTVEVTDKGKEPMSSRCRVWLNIDDFNTNSPKFVTPNNTQEFVMYLEEDTGPVVGSINRLIYTVVAVDADRGENGQVWYRFDNNTLDDHKSFSIGESSGKIWLHERLDYEKKAVYRATIIASDRGSPPLAPARLTFTLSVFDTDDNPPEFPRRVDTQPYILSSVEGQIPPVYVGNVSLATDRDTGPFSEICYCLNGSSYPEFTLDADTGNLSLTKEMDRESMATPALSLVVQARQKRGLCRDSCGATPSRSRRSIHDLSTDDNDSRAGRPRQYDATDLSLLWVMVKIEDTNDNPPVLKDNTTTLAVGITRDTQRDTVIFDLRESIMDADSDRFSVHEYYANGITMSASLKEKLDENDYTSEPFSLNRDGTLRTEMYFQKDMSGYFIFHFIAVDAGGNLTSAVYISLVNDDQRVRIIIRGNPQDVGKVKDAIAKKLSEVTGFLIVVDKIQTHDDIDGRHKAQKTLTDMFIHAENRVSKQVISAEVLTRKIDDNIQRLTQFYNKYNIIEVGPTSVKKEEDESEKQYKMALILVTVILAVIVIGLIAFFITQRRKYKRKLKATSSIFGNNSNYIDSQLKLDMPGTNLHATEASNPVWLEEYDNSAMQVESDGDDNSLDENVLTNQTGAELYDEQEINIDLFSDDAYSPSRVVSSSRPELYLSTALHAHDLATRKKDNVATSPSKNGSAKIINGYSNGGYDGVDRYILETTEI